MLKTLSTKSAEPRMGRVGVGNDKRAGRNGRCKLNKSGTGDNKFDDKINVEIGKKGQKTSKFKNFSKFKKTVRLDFPIFGARLAFTKLK